MKESPPTLLPFFWALFRGLVEWYTVPLRPPIPRLRDMMRDLLEINLSRFFSLNLVVLYLELLNIFLYSEYIFSLI
jgi:hypothetical protein